MTATVYPQIAWTDEHVARFWDYESQHPENYFTYQVGGNVVGGLLGYFPEARHALDYGAGLGFLTGHLLHRGFITTAAEFSPKSVAAISATYSGIPGFAGAFSASDILRLEKKFDLIMVVEVIEHLYDEHLENTFHNVKALLANGGRVVFTTPYDEDLSKSMIYCPQCDHVFHRWQHVRNWNIQTLAEFVSARGLEVVDIFATNFCQNPLPRLGSDAIPPGWPKPPHLVCIAQLPTNDWRHSTFAANAD